MFGVFESTKQDEWYEKYVFWIVVVAMVSLIVAFKLYCPDSDPIIVSRS